MAEEWQTLAEACQTLGISERTLYRRIDKGEFESKLDGNRRLVLITMPDKEVESDKAGELSDKSATIELEQENNRLQNALEQQNRQIEKLTRDLEGASKKLEKKDALLEDNRQRQDTIILQLTRQLDQSQRLLEYKSEPFYLRWFRRKRKESRSQN